MVKRTIFRYRVITNLNCNQNESTGPNGNCYFCYQPLKEPLQLDMNKANETMDKVGILKRATIMGGESTLRKDLPDIIRSVKAHVSEDVCLDNGTIEIVECSKEYYNTNYYLDYLWYRFIIPRYEIWFSKNYRDYILAAESHGFIVTNRFKKYEKEYTTLKAI